MTERQLQDAIVELAGILGWLVYHTHDSRHSAPGFPDLVLVRRGRLIFAELKTTKGAVSADQRAWLFALEVAGTIDDESDWMCPEVYVWRPDSWTSGLVEEVLRAT